MRWRVSVAGAGFVVVLVLVEVLFGVGGPSERCATVLAAVAPLGCAVILAQRPRVAVAAVAVLAVGLLALGVWVRPPEGALFPPPQDWLVPYYGFALLVVLVLLGMLLSGWQRLVVVPVAAVGVTTLFCSAQMTFFVVPLNPSGGRPSSEVREADFLPLPDELAVHEFKPDCSGAHTPCTRFYEVWSRHGASAAQVMDRAAAALRDRDWPMTASGDVYEGCRPVRGVFTWERQCLSLYATDRFIQPRRTSHPGAIVLWASTG
ncbi:hypothetical protein Daura_20085 [Dactylosporangium aurantiacum]|uniref:Uncharacterized protein n=1 Tax=Dactylosporangium aurantiacum TaxID=35754 RepID=A0A9Q9IQS4_9ACTN|nr:hypothetical protein [Dactylosporangium aurantiacum]MDG6106234.1 hypothetical protein [Dactylosporangium aurantiacum]UWZ58265.1 hypothetical protein Daura_20085 [Dactylosporangium aurantiacum]